MLTFVEKSNNASKKFYNIAKCHMLTLSIMQLRK